MTSVAILSAVRTPIGRFMGSLAAVPAKDLGIAATHAALRQAGAAPADIGEVVFGMARQAGNGPNPARQVGIGAGIPETVPAYTVNQACASGLQAVALAARSILAGEADLVLAGGMENMTRVPHYLESGRLGYRIGHSEVVDGMYRDGFQCPLADQLMGRTAETLAEQHGITRAEQDDFAAESQRRAHAAWEAGRFEAEVVPVAVPGRRGETTPFTRDEHLRPGTDAASLAKLPAVFKKDGTVHAGNSSGITDGAAALVLASRAEVERRGVTPLAWIAGSQSVGVDPRIMGIGPVPATRALMDRLKWQRKDVGLVELNEAFAAQALACIRELELDPELINVNGGAIALGHPIGATGARILTTLLHEMKRRETPKGLATLCVSGGMGFTLAVTRRHP
ncbi:MAG: acetyl-CoA acetyltransferase [Gemmatimonadota bacterium]|nr:MAG: acetyl-CoA acetyltransferase [Gemmatimonadota bacterium]